MHQAKAQGKNRVFRPDWPRQAFAGPGKGFHRNRDEFPVEPASQAQALRLRD
jgi:hypothetical protein